VTRTTQLILVAIFICALTAVGVIASIKTNVQDNQNSSGECEQACTRTYQECMGANNANRAQCQRDMQNCRANCRKPSPSPSPDISPSVEPTATPSPTP
jgi:hypothetical protein